mgnify:CR=1 FL=1
MQPVPGGLTSPSHNPPSGVKLQLVSLVHPPTSQPASSHSCRYIVLLYSRYVALLLTAPASSLILGVPPVFSDWLWVDSHCQPEARLGLEAAWRRQVSQCCVMSVASHPWTHTAHPALTALLTESWPALYAGARVSIVRTLQTNT